MKYRGDRVNEFLRSEISDLIRRELKDPRLEAGMVSITQVQASPDLRAARVSVSVMGDAAAQQDVLAALQRASGFLHRQLKSRMSTRNVPELTFQLDHSIEEGARVLSLMNELPPPVTPADDD